MNRFITAVSLVFVVAFLFLALGCKKNTTPQVYFSTSSATVNANGTASVTISLSEPSDNVVGVQLQSIGTSKIDFGTTSATFMHDDSDKMQAGIDANGYIDSMGHLQITPGAKGVVVSFAQKSDNFPHAAANFEIKMVAAQNATVRQGSNTYSYNINSSQVNNIFTSTINYTDITGNINGSYNLQTYTYTQNGSNYTLTLNYQPVTGVNGPPAVTIQYQNIAPFGLGGDTISCSNSSSVLLATYTSNGTPDTMTCSNLVSSSATMYVSNSKNPSSVFGGYWISTGTINFASSNYNYNISGSLNSPFLLYVQ